MDRSLYRIAFDFLLVVICLIVVASCLSFDIYDSPSKYASPHNSQASNWCGSIGGFAGPCVQFSDDVLEGHLVRVMLVKDSEDINIPVYQIPVMENIIAFPLPGALRELDEFDQEFFKVVRHISILYCWPVRQSCHHEQAVTASLTLSRPFCKEGLK